MKSIFALLALALTTCTTANALVLFHRVPEIDPSLAVTSLTLLAGAIAALHVRRKK